MALDEPNETDEVAEEQGYHFCMDQQLLAQVSRVTVNFSYMGFSIDPEVPINGGGGCASCSTGGGCASAN